MDGFRRRYGWALVLGAVLLSVAAGTIAYNIGLSQGLAQSAVADGTSIPPYAYGWHRPWGFAFPLLFIFLWFALARGLWWWGGPWRHRYVGDPSI